MAETFKQKVCDHYGVPLGRYEEVVLRLTLYPQAQWLRLFGTSELLAPDRRFVSEVGQLTNWHALTGAVWAYQRDPENKLFRRRSLRLRISVARMRALFSEIWGKSPLSEAEESPGAATPEPGA
ncbi:MAG: hypothetical protein V4773_30310 [Verrucomicrobiota bacterium]